MRDIQQGYDCERGLKSIVGAHCSLYYAGFACGKTTLVIDKLQVHAVSDTKSLNRKPQKGALFVQEFEPCRKEIALQKYKARQVRQLITSFSIRQEGNMQNGMHVRRESRLYIRLVP